MPVQTVDTLTFVGPLSGTVWKMTKDNVLWPARMDKKWLDQTVTEQGIRTFNAQYLQDPSPEQGAVLNRDWFKSWHTLLYHQKDKQEKELWIVHSWDMSFKGKENNDYVACAVFLTDGVTTQLVDKYKQNLSFTQTLQAVDAMYEKWNDIVQALGRKIPIEILVEDKANGPAVIDTLKDQLPGILPVNPMGDKYSRMSSVAVYVEAGNVSLPGNSTSLEIRKYAWLDDVLEDLLKFPAVAHDDFCDAFSQGLARIYLNRIRKKEMRIF